MSLQDRYSVYLESHGKRLTRERVTIVAQVIGFHERFEVEQLVAQLAEASVGNKVSRSTVYRALSEMEKAGVIRKAERLDDRELYERV